MLLSGVGLSVLVGVCHMPVMYQTTECVVVIMYFNLVFLHN